MCFVCTNRVAFLFRNGSGIFTQSFSLKAIHFFRNGFCKDVYILILRINNKISVIMKENVKAGLMDFMMTDRIRLV